MNEYEVNIENVNGNIVKNGKMFAVSKTNFTRATNHPTGDYLMIVDETAHKVDGYCVAFNGFWTDL